VRQSISASSLVPLCGMHVLVAAGNHTYPSRAYARLLRDSRSRSDISNRLQGDRVSGNEWTRPLLWRRRFGVNLEASIKA
jgi:hypothetical protein